MKVYRLLTAGLLALAPAAVHGAPPDQKPAPDPVAAGRKIYERERCAACHQIAKHGNSRFPLDADRKSVV